MGCALAYSASLQSLHSNNSDQIIQIEHNRIKKRNWQQVFTSMAEDLNSGLATTNPASDQSGDVVYAQTWPWKTHLTLKNCIEPPSYARTAYVVAMWPLFLFDSSVNIWVTCEMFLSKWFTAPPGKKFPVRLWIRPWTRDFISRVTRSLVGRRPRRLRSSAEDTSGAF